MPELRHTPLPLAPALALDKRVLAPVFAPASIFVASRTPDGSNLQPSTRPRAERNLAGVPGFRRLTGSQPPAAAAAQGVAGESWFFVTKLAEFPGNFPPVATLRTMGITGVMLEADDPLLESGAATARQNGFKVGVWANPANYSSVDTFIAAMQVAQRTADADAVALDVETEAKGPPGSDRYNLSQQIADAAKDAFPVPWAVTPIRSGKGDFDFTAYTNAGGTVIIQTYGTNPMTDLFDPVEVVQLALAAGVPANMISVIISPAQLPGALPALAAIGITSVSIWRQEGLTPEVVSASAPFLASAAQTPAAPAPSTGARPSSAPPPSADPGVSPETLATLSSASARATAQIEVVTPDADAVDDDTVDAVFWEVEESATVETQDLSPDTGDASARELESATGGYPSYCYVHPKEVVSPRRVTSSRFASYCTIPNGGYVQGKTGPVGTGIRQLELIIGTQNVYNDYAQTGHAQCSDHHCGCAMDIRATVQFWDWLFDHKNNLKLLLGPWGLYNYGVKFTNAKTQADHKDHIHVSTYLSAAEIRRVFQVKPGTGVPSTGGTRAPVPSSPAPKKYQPVAPGAAFKKLVKTAAVVWPEVGRNARKRGDALAKAISSGR